MIPGHKILEILMQECGWNPSPDQVDMFLYHYNDLSDPIPTEYRFQGALGFGGKLWMVRDRLYVNCYREDETPERLEMIHKANERLAKLVEAYAE